MRTRLRLHTNACARMQAGAGSNYPFLTQKERDVETGLDYFGARYYADTQGRFSGVDIARHDLSNPQTINKYQYCLNNPLRNIDRNGLYEEDVHVQLTYALALAAGFNSASAGDIASYNQWVDQNPTTSPMEFSLTQEAVDKRALWHFTTLQRRRDLWADFSRFDTLLDLGTYLHALQDSYSHEGYPADTGHLFDGSEPDKTYNNLGKADAMAEDTFSTLARARSIRVGKGKEKINFRAVQWKTIEPMVASFNRARKADDKQTIINQIIEEVHRQRAMDWDAEDALRRIRNQAPKNRKKH